MPEPSDQPRDHHSDAAGDQHATDATKATAAPRVEVTDDLVTTAHTLGRGRNALAYHASVGRVVLREEVTTDGTADGLKPKAEIGITAYTLDGADPRTRPVTFAFNGGPGSSSVWLHLGLLGPRRVVMGDAGHLLPPPYGLTDNPETLLRVSDLVMIDPVSTGWSRTVAGGKVAEYHGFKRDIESVGEVIRAWTSRNGRWMSPKFLAGESYGTTRAAALSEHLQTRYGMYLNGLMLISAVLDFGTAEFDMPRNDRAYALYLPHYAATAHYHGRHGRRTKLADVLAEAEAYANGEYRLVLAQGNRLASDDRRRAVSTVARLAGLTEDYVDRADLRIEHWRYYTELLRADGLTVGRIDSRFTGYAASRIAENMDADPSIDATTGPYTAAWQHYVHDELRYTSDIAFRTTTPDVNPWSYAEFEGRPVYVADKLQRAMRQNPHLKIYVGYGYYDGATPYFAAIDQIAQLELPQPLLDNISFSSYESGHMMYLHEPSRVAQSKDLAEFVTSASNR